jgi:hypothetical protein
MPTVGGYGAPDDDLRNDLRGDIDRYAALMKDMNPGYGDGLRDRIKVLAFSLDDPRIEDDATRTIYDWGFARPRLWEHYGDRHRGVCLCFDREGFTAYIRERLADEGTLLDDALVYRNEEISPRSLFFLAEDVRAEDRPSDAQIHRHREDFLFTKLCDWATEFEYRFALGTDHVRPVWVPYGNTLKAVVLGYATDNVYQPSLDLLCDASHAETFRLSWVNGFPRLAPAT